MFNQSNLLCTRIMLKLLCSPKHIAKLLNILPLIDSNYVPAYMGLK